jgi:hypothetical protein
LVALKRPAFCRGRVACGGESAFEEGELSCFQQVVNVEKMRAFVSGFKQGQRAGVE